MEFDFNCLYIYAPKMLICMLSLSPFERFFFKYYFIPENCETIKKKGLFPLNPFPENNVRGVYLYRLSLFYTDFFK